MTKHSVQYTTLSEIFVGRDFLEFYNSGWIPKFFGEI